MWQYRLSENCWSAREDRSAVLGLRHWERHVPVEVLSTTLVRAVVRPHSTSLKRVVGKERGPRVPSDINTEGW